MNRVVTGYEQGQEVRVAKIKTRVLLEVTWDDEVTIHPSEWDFQDHLQGNPFDSGAEKVRVVSHEDVDDHDRVEHT